MIVYTRFSRVTKKVINEGALNSTSRALLCKETLNRNENVTFMHSAFHSFSPLISFITRVSTVYPMLVKTLDKCQTKRSAIIFD